MVKLRKLKTVFMGMSLLCIAVGLAFMIWPGTSASVVCCLAGAAIMLLGLFRVFDYFREGGAGLAQRFGLAFGSFEVATAFILFFHTSFILAILPVVVGLMILADGALKFQTSVELKRTMYGRWWIELILAVVYAAFGIFLIVGTSGSTALAVHVGLCLVIDGVANLVELHWLAKGVERLIPIEVDGQIVD